MAARPPSWGLTPLEDQQLGGLIMWVPACLVYVFAGLALLAAWLRESERRVRRREARMAAGGRGGADHARGRGPMRRPDALVAAGPAASSAPAARTWGAPPPRRPAGRSRGAGRPSASYGCGSCHTIPGIEGADALVGPPLDRISSRTYVAGVLVNTPENLVRWVKNPPKVDPLTAMPNLHVTDPDARDIASFLATLR